MYLMYIVCVCCIDVICLFLAHLSQRHKKAFLIRICQFHVVVVVVVVGSVIVNSNQSFLCCQLFTFLSSGLERLGQSSLGDWESSQPHPLRVDHQHWKQIESGKVGRGLNQQNLICPNFQCLYYVFLCKKFGKENDSFALICLFMGM